MAAHHLPSRPDGEFAPIVVLVNGVPAAGKTTLARALARELRLPLFSKDVIKETHADILGADPPDDRPQRAWNRALGMAASETMWSLLGDAYGGAVLESTFLADVRPLVAAGLRRAGVRRAVEVWCDVPIELARRRYEERHPDVHGVHGGGATDEEWSRFRSRAIPLGLGPVRRIDTAGPVDLAELAAWCRAES